MSAPVRPMRFADYGQGRPMFGDADPAAAAASAGDPLAEMSHPMRDAFIGAMIAATALWIVPRVLDYASDWIRGDADDFELEVER